VADVSRHAACERGPRRSRRVAVAVRRVSAQRSPAKTVLNSTPTVIPIVTTVVA
jgi:hypothetical protein